MFAFDFNFPIISYVLFGCALLCLIYIGAVYCRRLYRLRRAFAECEERETPDGALPTVSVIVFARSEPETLLANLPAILEQEYPYPFEVIVVNDGASPDTNFAVGQLKAKYPNIYLTFTPEGVRSLSRKKLAITLGVKAAKGEAVLITEASAHVGSNQWLKAMMRNFADPQVGMVLGYGAMMPPEERVLWRKTRAFDLAADDAAWMLAAVNGAPYRACGYNVAYRRKLFFDNKGFSRSLNLRAGDDDIFISELAELCECAYEFAYDANVGLEVSPFVKDAREYRLSHAFTGRNLSKKSRRLMAIGEWCMWLVMLFSVVGAYFCGLLNLAGWALAFVFVLLAMLIVGISWHKTLRVMGVAHWCIALPFQAMTRPGRNITINADSAFSEAGHYTWS